MGRLENRLELLLWATTLALLAALAWETASLRTKLDTLSSQENRYKTHCNTCRHVAQPSARLLP